MTGTIYNNASDKRVIGKTLNNAVSIATMQVLDDCSLIKPSFIIAYTAAHLTKNYLYISAWARYYFIDNITILDAGRIRLDCSVDVLESNKTAILALKCTIKRQQNVYNLYLDDPLFQAQNKRQIVTKKIGTGSPFTPSALTGAQCFVFTTVGGAV